MNNSNNNRRILKNTLFLYFRMILTLGVSLYTSRVVLNTLGVEDFGIYSIVGGVVTMMIFLSGAMSSATQRFLSFELGKNDTLQLHNVFKMSVNIHLLIVVIVVIVLETVGLWFLNTHLVIPAERLAAANWVFHCAVFSFCCVIMGVPYNAAIIAHEKMSAFAYISIADVCLKLIMVFILQQGLGDRLENYALLMAFVNVFILGCYFVYARCNFVTTRYQWFWEPSLFKTLLSYTGWNLFGNLASVATNQGVNILLNVFFGATVNAARAIAFQVNAAMMGFVSSLHTSINPQIVKSYAANDYQYMQKLVFSGARYSFFLLFFLAIPILLQTNVILTVWLGVVPDYTVNFVRLVIVDSLIISLSGTLMTAFQARGRIKKYQIIVGLIIMCNLPISYIFLKMGFDASVAMVISIMISLVALFARVILLSQHFDYIINSFMALLLRVLVVSIGSLLFALVLPVYNGAPILSFILTCVGCWSITLVFIIFFGLTGVERKYLELKFKTFLRRLYW